MVHHSAYSLKSKIRLIVGALAFFVAAFGVGSWLLIALVAENSFYTALVQFALAAAAIVAGGWRLSVEVARPIEKVALLAKSLERGNVVSLPPTSGTLETDELLQTLRRSHQQLQNLVGLMDKVANGNTDVVLAPLEQNDRLSDSFRRLLAKVTEAINARRDLERLQTALRAITDESARIRHGGFDVEFKSNHRQTEDISETLNFLIENLSDLVELVKNESGQTQNAAREIRRTLQNIIGADELRLREMRQAAQTFQQIPQTVRNISEELFASSHAARHSIERARSGSRLGQQNLAAVNALRGQMRDTAKRVGQLNARTAEIEKAARVIGDLAQRTNLIALNASLPNVETTTARGESAAFAGEFKRLAERAADAHRQISTLHKTFASEIAEIENGLRETVGEAANLSRFAIESGNALAEVEKYTQSFMNLQEKLCASAGAQSTDAETAFQSFAAAIETTEAAVRNLREAETPTAQTAASMENLQIAVQAFKTRTAAADAPPVNEYSKMFEPDVSV